VAEIGLFLSSEEHGPRALLRFGQMGEAAGLRSVFVSDHYHPWLESQGESPFVWSVIAALGATTGLRVTTGVTCPTVRIHPAIVAQAAATTSLLLEGRFALGVGSGEALNEHILGHRWPPAPTRLEMLEEAIDVMRKLWTGEEVTHRGRYYTVENARIYSLPASPPKVLVSGFGPRAVELAARVGDGFVTVQPDTSALERYRSHGGSGPTVAALKVCWNADEQAARKLAHEIWRTTGVHGELNQELPTPAHFEQASELVTEALVAESIPCGPDPEVHLAAIRPYLEAGFDEIYISQVGDDQEGFLRFYVDELARRVDA